MSAKLALQKYPQEYPRPWYQQSLNGRWNKCIKQGNIKMKTKRKESAKEKVCVGNKSIPFNNNSQNQWAQFSN